MRTDPSVSWSTGQQMFASQGTVTRPTMMPMDAWRDGELEAVEASDLRKYRRRRSRGHVPAAGCRC